MVFISEDGAEVGHPLSVPWMCKQTGVFVCKVRYVRWRSVCARECVRVYVCAQVWVRVVVQMTYLGAQVSTTIAWLSFFPTYFEVRRR